MVDGRDALAAAQPVQITPEVQLGEQGIPHGDCLRLAAEEVEARLPVQRQRGIITLGHRELNDPEPGQPLRMGQEFVQQALGNSQTPVAIRDVQPEQGRLVPDLFPRPETKADNAQ